VISVEYSEFDLMKLAGAIQRQLRYHGAYEVFTEVVDMGLEVYGLDAPKSYRPDPRPMAWGLHGSTVLFQLLKQHPITEREWANICSDFGKVLKGLPTKGRSPFGTLEGHRGKLRGPHVKKGSNLSTVAAVIAALQPRGVITAFDDSLSNGRKSINGAFIEVAGGSLNYGLDLYHGTGDLRWGQMCTKQFRIATPIAYRALVRDVICVDDPFLETILAAYHHTMRDLFPERFPSQYAQLNEIFRQLRTDMEARAHAASVYDAVEGVGTQPVGRRGAFRHRYDTTKLAKEASLGDILVRCREQRLSKRMGYTVNMLELFNFYVLRHEVVSPKGFYDLTRIDPLVEKPEPQAVVANVAIWRLKRWHDNLHDVD